MPQNVATVIYALIIASLFFLDRDRDSSVSPALWLPAAWLSIGASRNVSAWLGVGPVLNTPDQFLEGSPLDATLFALLEVAAVIVLVRRQPRSGAFLSANGPLLAFFLYLLVSVVWSDFPLTAFKRWTKAAGNLVMVLVVLTDADPVAAVKRLLSRMAFVLIPLSVLFIKYYPEIGRGFSVWTGAAYNSGVAVGKNGLGIVCLLAGLGSLWRLIPAFGGGARRRRARPLIVHGAVLAITLWLLSMADSATSLGCFLIGGALMTLASLRSFARTPALVHAVTIGIVAVAAFGLLINTQAGLVQAMGRDDTLTTRTDLWADLMRMPVNPLLGTGFESFWLGDRAKLLWKLHWWHPNQAHNGYLELYLNNGWLGLGLLAIVVVSGYRNTVAALQQEPELGRLRLAFFVAALIYNFTEAAFKVMHPVWIAFLLAVTVIPRRSSSRRELIGSTAPVGWSAG